MQEISGIFGKHHEARDKQPDSIKILVGILQACHD